MCEGEYEGECARLNQTKPGTLVGEKGESECEGESRQTRTRRCRHCLACMCVVCLNKGAAEDGADYRVEGEGKGEGESGC